MAGETKIEGGAPRFKLAKTWANYKKQIQLWEKTCKADKVDRGKLLLDALCDDNPIKPGLRTNAFDFLTVDEIYHENGLKKVFDYLDKEMGTEDLFGMAHAWKDLINFKRKSDMDARTFISEMERKWKAAEVAKCGTVSQKVQALQMIEASGVSDDKKNLILGYSQGTTTDKDFYDKVREQLKIQMGGALPKESTSRREDSVVQVSKDEPSSKAETYEIAVEWLKVAADKGVPEAMYLLFRVLVTEGGLRVDRRVAHFWLDKAYATGSMDDLVQILQTPMDNNFPMQFDILFLNLTKGGLVPDVLSGDSLALLLMASRFRELKAWDGKTAMGKRFYAFPIFKSVMEVIGELKNEQSGPSLIEGEKKTILVISTRFGSSDFYDKCVSLEREENNLKFLQGVKEKASPDYQLMCQKSNVDGRTSYLISCKHDKADTEEAERGVYSKIWGGLRVGRENNLMKNHKLAGECEPCVQEAQQRLRAVSLGLFSISLTPVFEDRFYAARYAKEDGVIVQDVFIGYNKPDMRQLLQCLMSNPADLHPVAIAEDGNVFWPIIWFWGSVYEAVQDTCDKITLDAIYHSLGKKIAFAKNKNASARAAFPEAAAREWRMACGNESCVKVDHEGKMSLCRGCKVRRYCDEACQRKDWTKHMKFCKAGKKQGK